MKVLSNLSIPKAVDTDKPFGVKIKDETATEVGTPIITDLMQDIFSNLYRLLELTGITPTGAFDGDSTQYQLIDAIKKLPNSLNDIEQVLTLDSTTWTIGFNLDLLPNKYFFIARPSHDYVQGASYSFKGSTATTYGFTSNGFKSGDEILVVIDTGGVRAYSLSQIGQADETVFPMIESPLSFNDTNKMWYSDSGSLISDVPSIDGLQAVIRADLSSVSVVVKDIFVVGGYVLCFCLNTGNNYFFRQFDLLDLSVSEAVTITGTSFGNSSDYLPYVYVESGFVHITNTMNTTANDYAFTKLSYDPSSAAMALVSSVNMDVTFVKTKDAVIKSGLLYTLASGKLDTFDLSDGTKTLLGDYLGLTGQLFGFNGAIYFRVGQTAKKWF